MELTKEERALLYYDSISIEIDTATESYQLANADQMISIFASEFKGVTVRGFSISTLVQNLEEAGNIKMASINMEYKLSTFQAKQLLRSLNQKNKPNIILS